MSTKLSVEEAKSITDWLNLIGLQSAYWPVAFADGCQMARILKKMYPELVNLHLFQHRLNTDAKFMNWELLNRVVLKPINLPQSEETLKKLANATPGIVEQLLLQIMSKYNEKFPISAVDGILPLSVLENKIDEFVKEQELLVQAFTNEQLVLAQKREELQHIEFLLKKLSYFRRLVQDMFD